MIGYRLLIYIKSRTDRETPPDGFEPSTTRLLHWRKFLRLTAGRSTTELRRHVVYGPSDSRSFRTVCSISNRRDFSCGRKSPTLSVVTAPSGEGRIRPSCSRILSE